MGFLIGLPAAIPALPPSVPTATTEMILLRRKSDRVTARHEPGWCLSISLWVKSKVQGSL